MQKETFYNLSEEKRQRIIEAGVHEFANHSYQASSINNIAKNCSVSKGSIYQYFDDKKDLYSFIINYVREHKNQTVFAHINKQYNFEDQLRMIFISGVAFAIQNPHLVKVWHKFQLESADEMAEKFKNEDGDRLRSLVEKAKKNNEISHDINSDLVTNYIYHLNQIIISQIKLQNIMDGKIESIDEYEMLVNDILDIFFNGIKNKKGKRL